MNEDEFAAARNRMVDMQIKIRGIDTPRMLAAIRQVPRHRFVPRGLWDQAYNDYPLPIGEDQTISQPYIVALMTEALELMAGDRVLEIGTGSGYQAAILAELATAVYSIDRIASLAKKARQILEELGYTNFQIQVGDGTQGWPEQAPFDAILVTAGTPQVPRPLVDQLALGGKLVVPVGDRFSQTLTRVRQTKDGVKFDSLGGCRFVCLIGKYGWPEGRQGE